MKTDLLVIGSGPAGLQAAIHASRRKMRVVVAGRIGESNLKKAKVENYCCMELLANGRDLLEKGRNQCMKFGVIFKEEDVVRVERTDSGDFVAELSNGENLETSAFVIAIGTALTKAGIKGENEYHGKGVSYCVDCDAGFFKSKKVVVIGNGTAAVTGAQLLKLYAREVVLIARKLDVNDKLKDQLVASGILFIEGCWIKEIRGDGARVTGCILDNGDAMTVDGVFVELGAKGVLALFSPMGVELDPETFTYILTDKKQKTNIEGIYAAGDICGAPFQLAKAVGEGCVAGISASDYINSLSR